MSIRVAVIGAGAAGLCAVRHLASRPSLFSVTAFEQSAGVGGTWVYTDSTGTDTNGLPIHSSMYRNLKTNLPKEVMAFPDFPFDKRLPSFITHADVLQYLEEYAVNFNLLQYIKFDTQVIEVKPVSCPKDQSSSGQDQKWELTSAPSVDKNNRTVEEYDAVMICNGHYSVPLIPQIPGLDTFPGEIMHSHNYRVPEHFKDKRVVCLGAAASGQDICIDLARAAQMVYLCHNKRSLQSPFPSNVEQRPGISSISGSCVTLKDGSEIVVDCLLFCTGYRFSFPFLSDACRLHIEDERVTPLYKHVIHTEFPSLSFIGICKTVCPFPHFNLQALLAISVLDGSLKLPSKEEMDLDTEADFQKRLAEEMPKRYAHTMGTKQWEYNDEIATLAGSNLISKTVQNLYDAVHEMRVKNLMTYKQDNYELVDGSFHVK